MGLMLVRSLSRVLSVSTLLAASAPQQLLVSTTHQHVKQRHFFSSPVLRSDLDDKFNAAVARVQSPANGIEVPNTTKLELYGLFKQATEGRPTGERPSMLRFVERAKFESWESLGDMSKDAAKEKYISIMDSLFAGSSAPQAAPAQETVEGYGPFLGLSVGLDGSVLTVTLNRPTRKNALDKAAYLDLTLLLNQSAQDSRVKVLVLTGSGDFYCSGNDLTALASSEPATMAKEARVMLQNYVNAYIRFPKLLVAAVNGPAIGIAVTVLGLCDIVYATDRATFNTPFVKLGQSPEGCSSYTFPKLMGAAKANEVLLLNRKLSAYEALELGLLTAVFPQKQFHEEVRRRLAGMQDIPVESLALSKKLIREKEIPILEEVNRRECALLEERWQSEECHTAVTEFLIRKKEKK